MEYIGLCVAPPGECVQKENTKMIQILMTLISVDLNAVIVIVINHQSVNQLLFIVARISGEHDSKEVTTQFRCLSNGRLGKKNSADDVG